MIVRLRSLARGLTLSMLAQVTKAPSQPSLRLLHCHHVLDDQVSQFEACIALLRSMGEFVSAETVVGVARGLVPIERNMFHLSFDDGFKDIITNALPILERHHIPALLFVPAGYILNTERLSPAQVFGTALPMASWGDLENAAERGLEIASHTRTHIRLSDISESRSALEDEILGSKEDIERRLGSCRYISWPYGTRKDADDAALQVVREAGYEACFGAFRGRIIPDETDPFRIPRHHFEPHWPLSHIRYFASGGMERGERFKM